MSSMMLLLVGSWAHADEDVNLAKSSQPARHASFEGCENDLNQYEATRTDNRITCRAKFFPFSFAPLFRVSSSHVSDSISMKKWNKIDF